jgi:hypothetical protein
MNMKFKVQRSRFKVADLGRTELPTLNFEQGTLNLEL